MNQFEQAQDPITTQEIPLPERDPWTVFPHTGQRLLLVNGPPRSGKDTVGEVLKEWFPGKVYVTKFAKILKERTHALYGMAGTEHDYFEAIKDVPNAAFLGLTPRKAYIGVSELLMKPQHGQDIFGNLLIEDIETNGFLADLVVVTDSGFEAEALPLINAYGRVNSNLIRLCRPGTNFEGDSRSYIGMQTRLTKGDFDIFNDGDKLELAESLSHFLDFKLRFRVEVLIPGPNNELTWFQQGEARETMAGALAAIEALRRGSYGNRSMRVATPAGRALRIVMPGDAPVAEFGT